MKSFLTAFVSLVILAGGISEAAQTKITVRAKAKDAKFIASSMGGALIIIKDSESGEVLAKGFTAGTTGNTNRIMIEPIKRGAQLSDAASAKFEATIDIEEPRLVTIEVHSPYAQRQSMTKNTTQVWLLPGKDVLGDGIVVEVPGFAVDIIAPEPPDGIKLTSGRALVAVRASVVMMCGCTLNPGGMWDSGKYEIAAIVKHEGKVIGTVPLKYAEKPSYFEGTLELTKSGLYELIVYAHDPNNGNTGLDRTTFTVF